MQEFNNIIAYTMILFSYLRFKHDEFSVLLMNKIEDIYNEYN